MFGNLPNHIAGCFKPRTPKGVVGAVMTATDGNHGLDGDRVENALAFLVKQDNSGARSQERVHLTHLQ